MYKNVILKFYNKLKKIISAEKKQKAKVVYVRDFNACYDITEDLVPDIIYVSTNKVHIFKTDHLAVTIYFHKDNLFHTKQIAKKKKHNKDNLQVNYRKIDKEIWEKYVEEMEKLLNKEKDVIDSIDKKWYKVVTQPITESEWNNTVRQLANKKALEMSKISNEMLKHMENSMKKIMLKLANIYWKYLLIKTQPIILLKMLRKVVVKIITKRLSKIIADHNILKGGNHVGLFGDSTEAPLRIINTLQSLALLFDNMLTIRANGIKVNQIQGGSLPLIDLFTYKKLFKVVLLRHSLIENNVDSKEFKSKNWIATFNDQVNTLIIGHIIDKSDNGKFVIEHWIQEIENDTISPSLQLPIIKKCRGCEIKTD
ncbi:hypothetical protein C1646_769005 [Rhizophagus diaphanus]|nr:hypothetical protein C1646_769005 [Rhizophagus diaphanus] [Rhizophagus sp. MUCL 43196]